MRNFRYTWLTIILLMVVTAHNAPLHAQIYKLVWSDEFDSTSIDQSKWAFETGNNNGWGNSELEYYTNRTTNAYVDSGRLVIKAIKEDYPPLTLAYHYTSARMKTQGKASWTYGKIEARMKLPYGQGLWPAFWMLGDNISSVSWPKCGEIDIMEMIGGSGTRNSTVYGTAHWDNNGHVSSGGSKTYLSGRLADDYHIYSIIWTAQNISWLLDGVQYYTFPFTPAALVAFQKNQFILLNLAVGGAWPGNPDLTTVFPQTMMVDYVRVYQEVVPTTTITLSSSSWVAANSDLVLTANATTAIGTVSKVEFFQDAMKIGEDVAAPYTLTLKNVLTGYYHFTAKVTTSFGETLTSSASAVLVDGTADTAPYGATAAAVPGTIEMENYDLGGAGAAYFDADAGNAGNVYRSDDVDLEQCSDAGGGYDIGWTANDEWLIYTIDVKQAGGLYRFVTRVASLSGGGKYHIEIDGADVTGIISVPATLGWQTWQSSASSGVALKAGIHTMKFYINTGGFNINKIDIQYAPTSVGQNHVTPDQFALGQNYPNPFNPSTTIRFSLPASEQVKLAVYDVMGEEVASIVDGKKDAGSYAVEWNASALPSGVYFYRITAGKFSETRRLILQK